MWSIREKIIYKIYINLAISGIMFKRSLQILEMVKINTKLIKIIILVLVLCICVGCESLSIFESDDSLVFTRILDEINNNIVSDAELFIQTPYKEINTPEATAVAIPTPISEPYTEIVIGGAGDIMAHIQQINDAKLAGAGQGYSFYHWFEIIKPALQYPDLMIANLEGPIAGEKAEYNGYPMFNFPDEIVPAIIDAGIDVVTNANNHIMDKQIEGINRTISVLDEASLYHTGAWESSKDRSTPLVIDVKGIKVGVVACTYSLNGFARHIEPDVLEYLVCFLDEAQVKEQIDLCKDYGAEVIVVCPHMGDEYVNTPRRGTRDYAESYIKMGADIVFAHHPHVLQTVEIVEIELDDGMIKRGIVYYSLGNFVSSMYSVSKEAGVIAYVTIRRDNKTGEIEITNSEYLPTWVLRYSDDGNGFHILPVGECIDFPEIIDFLEPNRGNFYRFDAVWESTTSIMGDEAALPLRYMPER